MAKRKSFDEKSKGMHKSRKLIIDTVFGRTDNTQRVHGYEGEAQVKREVGEIWTDSDGKKWEQKEGFKIAHSDMDDVRAFLDKLNTCSAEDCKTTKHSWADKRLIRKSGMCATCLAKFESKLKGDGTYPFYADYKVTRNKLAYIRELKSKMEESLSGIKDHFETITEDGKLERWEWNVDIEQVKKDLKKDINSAYEAIELLIVRKGELEKKLRELNHPELIKN